MMNIFSTTVNNERIYFNDAENVVSFLRNLIEKDGCTYPTKISTWKENRKRTKIICHLQWTRVDPITHEVKTISKTVVCTEPDEMVVSVNSEWRKQWYYYGEDYKVVTTYIYKALTW